MGIFLALALVAGSLAVNQRNAARGASLAADVRALQSAALSEDRWDRALLYAAQAQLFDPSAESRAALLQTVQRGPEAKAILMAGQPLHSLAVSADGRKLVAGGSNGTVFVMDTETRRVEEIPDVTVFDANLLDLSPDGRYLAALSVPVSHHQQGLLDWRLAVVDLEQTPRAVRYLRATRGEPRFAANSRTIMTMDGFGRVQYLDVETGNVQRTVNLTPVGPEHSFKALSGPENRQFVVAEDTSVGSVVAWEVSTGRQIWSASEEDLLVAAVSPDGSWIMVGHADGRIERIDTRTGNSTPVTSSLSEGLIDVTWAPNGLSFAGATQDRTVLVWDAETLQTRVVLRGHWGKVSKLAYAPDGSTLYAAGLDQAVLAWDLTGDTSAVTEIDGLRPTGAVYTSALADDGSVVAVGYQDDEGFAQVEVSEIPGGRKFKVNVPEGPLNFWRIKADRLGRSVLLVLGEWGA